MVCLEMDLINTCNYLQLIAQMQWIMLIMLFATNYAYSYQLCSKLCRHNWESPTCNALCLIPWIHRTVFLA